MIEPITQEQWDDWKARPITRKLFKYYSDLWAMSSKLIDMESRKIPLTQEEITHSTINRVVNVEKEDNYKNMANLTNEIINDFYGVEEEKDETEK